MKTDDSDQKQYRQNKHQQNRIQQKIKMRRKTNVSTFQETKKRNLAWENLDMTKKLNL